MMREGVVGAGVELGLHQCTRNIANVHNPHAKKATIKEIASCDWYVEE